MTHSSSRLQIYILRNNSKRLDLFGLATVITARQPAVDARDKAPRTTVDLPLMQTGAGGSQQEVGRASVSLEVVMDSEGGSVAARHLVSSSQAMSD